MRTNRKRPCHRQLNKLALVQVGAILSKTTIPKVLKNEILKRDSFSCVVCKFSVQCLGLHGQLYVLDCAHLYPSEHGGPNHINNLISLCPNCHRIFDRKGFWFDPDSCNLVINPTTKGFNPKFCNQEHIEMHTSRGNREGRKKWATEDEF